MVRRLFLLYLSVLTTLLVSLAAPSIVMANSTVDYQTLSQKQVDMTVKFRPKTVQLGNPVTLVIEGDELAESIAKIDWKLFSQDFVIDDINQGSSLLRVRFYPLKSGEFTLPKQRAGVIDIPETLITVKQNPAVKVSWQTPNDKFYSQQQFSWSAQVDVINPAFLVEMYPRDGGINDALKVYHRKDSVEHTPQAGQTSEVKSSSILEKWLGKSHHLVSSYELPSLLEQQVIEIHSPVIEVKNTTNRKWKFFDKSQMITISPLPSFLPLSAAVGQLDWQIAEPSVLYQSGQLHYWQWTLIGNNVTLDYLKGTAYQLLRQLDNSENVLWLSESMEGQQFITENGMLSELTIDIPYRVNQPGLVTFPELTLRAFNPSSGKVNQQSLPSSHAFGLPSWLIWTAKWIMLLFGLAMAFVSLLAIKQAWLNWRFKQAVKRCVNTEMLWSLMQNWQQSHYKGVVVLNRTSLTKRPFSWHSFYQKVSFKNHQGSIQQWQDWYLSFYLSSTDFTELVEQLNIRCYASPKSAPDEHILAISQQWGETIPIFKLPLKIKSSEVSLS